MSRLAVSLLGVAALGLVTSAQAANMMLDFGTGAGQSSTTGGAISVWGGWGSPAPTVSFNTNAVDVAWPALGAWAGGGAQIRNGNAFTALSLSNVDPTQPVELSARCLLGNQSQTYNVYKLNLILYSSSGASSTYAFIGNNGFVNGTAPFQNDAGGATSNLTLVSAMSNLSSPIATSSGGVQWGGSGTLTGMDLFLQAGNFGTSSALTLEVDSLQFVVPEPVSFGLLAMASPLLLRRRRSA